MNFHRPRVCTSSIQTTSTIGWELLPKLVSPRYVLIEAWVCVGLPEVCAYRGIVDPLKICAYKGVRSSVIWVCVWRHVFIREGNTLAELFVVTRYEFVCFMGVCLLTGTECNCKCVRASEGVWLGLSRICGMSVVVSGVLWHVGSSKGITVGRR